MRYDFDRVIDRMGTYSTQWDYAADRFGSADVLPFSISDTDFAVPDEVMNALRARMEHPIFGYTRWNHSDYKGSVAGWFARDGASHVDMDWVVYSPSVIFSAATVIRLVSEPNDAVVTLTPMYDAFYGLIEGNGRELVAVAQASAMDGYGLDWDTLEVALARPEAKVMLLTNPHNPTGKVFTAGELARIVELCHANGVFLISDDIHRDMILGETPYTPVTNITREGVALLCSASKTFNTPGLIGSYALIPDDDLRERFLFELKQKKRPVECEYLGDDCPDGGVSLVLRVCGRACGLYSRQHAGAQGFPCRQSARDPLCGAAGDLSCLDGCLGPGVGCGRAPAPAR